MASSSILSIPYVSGSNVSDHQVDSVSYNKACDFVKKNVSVSSHDILDNMPIFNETENTYTCLQRDQSYNSVKKVQTNSIRLYIKGLVSKIVLDDFPVTGQYILSINGSNQCTARLTLENNLLKPTFDLSDLKSSTSKAMRTAINQNVRPNLVDKCYDMSRVDALVINVSTGTKINHCHRIIVSEYNRDYFQETFNDSNSDSNTGPVMNDDLIYQSIQTTYTIYPSDTHNLAFCHPVYALNIISNKKMDFQVVINGAVYGPFTSDNQYIRLSCNDHSDVFQGVENLYLNPEQQKSLNCSRIDSMQIIVLNNDDDSITFFVDALTFVSYCKNNAVRLYSH